jgi:hypothetical protein
MTELVAAGAALGAVWDMYRRATGESFLPTVALGVLAVLIVWGWRSPKLPWFTGRVALAVVAVLVLLLTAVVLLVEIQRQGG